MIFVYILIIIFLFLRLFIQERKKFYFLFPLLIINFFISISYIIVDEITGNGYTRSFWYHLNFNLTAGTLDPYLFSLSLKFLFLLFLIITVIIFGKKKFQHKIQNLFLTCILLLFLNPSFFSLIPSYISWKNLNLNSLEKVNLDEYFYSINIEEVKKTFEKRDIIFISAESFERTYYSGNIILNKNLIDREDIYDFSSIQQIENYTDWTIAGLVAANCGRPIIYSDNSQNIDHYNSFVNKSLCLSDVLNYLDYDQYLIQGSSLNFAGNGNFYKIHKVLNQFGKEEIINNSKNIDLELSHWGIHDNHVLDFALKKIDLLEKKKTPYSIWINTLDNHAPNGLLSNYCKTLFPNIQSQMIKIANCTDKILNDFIENIFKNDISKNNLVVLHSDHLLMNSNFQKSFFDKYEVRKNLFLIIDPYKIKMKKIFSSRGNHFDIPATIIDYLSGIKNIGFGKSLINSQLLTKNSDFTINDKFNDFQLIKSYENLLKKKNFSDISFKINDLDNENIIIENILELSLPIIILPNEIISSPHNVDGDAKYNLTELISKNQNKILSSKNVQIISKCSDINSIFNFDIKCKQSILNIVRQNTNYSLNFLKVAPNKVYFTNKQEYDFSILKNKDFLNQIFKNNSNYQLDESFKYLSKKIKLFLNEINPELLKVTRNFVRKIKYIITKYHIIGLENLLTFKKFIPNKEIFIVHAGGEIDNYKYTNSLEALNLNYDKGARYIELDLRFTSDNELVAVHDWESWQKMTSFYGAIPPSKDIFLNQKIYEKYNPIDLNILQDWIKSHNDTIILTDKVDNLKILKKYFKNVDNFLHEIYNKEELDYAFENNISNILISEKILTEYNFDNNFLKKLVKNNIYGLSVSRYSIYKFPKFYKKAKSMGLKIFVYRLNDGLPGGSEKEVVCNFNDFLTAIYADKIPNLNSQEISNYCS